MMFNRTKTNEVHNFIMAQIADIEECMRSFEAFIRAACDPSTPPDTLTALSDGV